MKHCTEHLELPSSFQLQKKTSLCVRCKTHSTYWLSKRSSGFHPPHVSSGHFQWKWNQTAFLPPKKKNRLCPLQACFAHMQLSSSQVSTLNTAQFIGFSSGAQKQGRGKNRGKSEKQGRIKSGNWCWMWSGKWRRQHKGFCQIATQQTNITIPQHASST